MKTNRSAPKTIKLTDTLENFAKEPQILTKRDHIVDRMDQTIITLLKAVQVRKQDKKKEWREKKIGGCTTTYIRQEWGDTVE